MPSRAFPVPVLVTCPQGRTLLSEHKYVQLFNGTVIF